MLSGKISVVMPAFNEARFIEQNLIETVETFESFGYDFEVIAVDDGSSDNTHVRAAKAQLRHPERVRVVRYDRNRGKGNALICGTQYATGDYVVFLDADMDLHPSQLPTLFEIMDVNGADVVIGSKRHPLSNVNYPTRRKILSTGYFLFVRLCFGLPLRDTQTGLKVFKTRVLRTVFPRIACKRFAFDVEVLAVAHHMTYKVVDAPVTLRFSRSFSRINLADAWATFVDTLAIFYRLRVLKYYDRQVAPDSEPLRMPDSWEVDARALAGMQSSKA